MIINYGIKQPRGFLTLGGENKLASLARKISDLVDIFNNNVSIGSK